MEEVSFWNKVVSRTYGSYFVISMANIICWIGSFQILAYFTAPDPPTFYILIFTVAAISFSIISGKFVDKSFNRRKFILLGFSLYVLGFLLPFFILSYSFTLIESTIDIILISIFLGMAFGFSTVSVGSYFADVSSPRERGKLQGLTYCLAIAFSFFLVLYFAGLSFIIAVLTVLGILLIVFNIFYQQPSHSERISEKIEQTSYKAVFGNKNFIRYALSFLLFLIALPFIQVFLESPIIPTEFTQISTLIYYPLLAVFALLGGFWADRGRRSMILISFLILGLGFAIWGILDAWSIANLVVTLIIIWILVSTGNAITNITDFIIPSDHAPPTSRGKYIAVFFMATNAGMLISTLLQPYIITLEIATIALIVTTLLLFAITPTILTKEPLEEALAMEVDVKGVYVIAQDGRCMVEMSFKDILIDVDLITSALSAVGSLIKESIHSEKKLKSIDHEDVKLLIEYGDYVNAAIIADKETADIRDRLDRFLNEFETNYQEYVSHWTGDVRPFFEAYKLIESYFGIYLAKK